MRSSGIDAHPADICSGYVILKGPAVSRAGRLHNSTPSHPVSTGNSRKWNNKKKIAKVKIAKKKKKGAEQRISEIFGQEFSRGARMRSMIVVFPG